MSSPAVVTHSAELPLQPSGTLLQRTQCRSSSSPAPVAQSQAVTSVVVAGQDKLQTASKEPPTLILPITGLLGIPGPLVLRIRLGKYVDLGDLLPEALKWALERLMEEKKEEGKKKKFSVATVAGWSLAFATYMAMAVHFDPKLASPLAVYMAIVARLAREVPGQAWLRYDKLFRQAVAVNPALPWDRREPDVWLAAMAEQPRLGGTSFVNPGHSPAPWDGPESAGEICKRYTREECPSQVACKFRHACMLCKSPGHPARDCFMLRPPARRSAPSD